MNSGSPWRALLGIERNTTSHAEKLLSALGAFLGILLVYWLSAHVLSNTTSRTLVVASMGASAVLLFAVPHGALSQPWPVLGGNVISALLLAFLFNHAFAWRHYPAALGKRHAPAALPAPALRDVELTQEDFAAAMQQLDSCIDITVDGLTELLELARGNAARDTLHPAQILPGHCYSNGRLGRQWSVRQIIDAAEGAPPGKDQVIYKVLAGDGAWETGLCLRSEFRQWARFEVVQEKGHWVKVQEP